MTEGFVRSFLDRVSTWALVADFQAISSIWDVSPGFVEERRRVLDLKLTMTGDAALNVAHVLLATLPELSTPNAVDHILAVILVSIRTGLSPAVQNQAIRHICNPPLARMSGAQQLCTRFDTSLESLQSIIR